MSRTPGSAGRRRSGCRSSATGAAMSRMLPEPGRGRQSVADSCPRPLPQPRGSPTVGTVTRILGPVATRIGGPDDVLAEADVTAFVADQLARQDLDGRSVCVIVPDATRSCPLPLLLSAVHGALAGRVSRMT